MSIAAKVDRHQCSSKKLALLLFIITILIQCLPAQTYLPQGFSNTLLSQWNQAVGLSFNKAGNLMFVWEKAGRVWIVENNVKTLFIDISEEVGNFHDHGLLGFALHPQFETNGYFYLLYTVDRHHLLYFGTSSYSSTTDLYSPPTIGRLTQYTAMKSSTGSYTINTSSRKILIGATKTTGIPMLTSSHGVGSLCFGSDGTLLISTGDGATWISTDTGSYGAHTYYQQALADGIIPPEQNVGAFRSQQIQSYNGKILRIDPLTGNGLPSNPFYESTNPGSVRSKVWCLGLRQPFRISVKPGSGSLNPADGRPGTIYIGDVGWEQWEEVDVATKGGFNFGWPLFEGLTPQEGYSVKKTYNKYAPNPLYHPTNCPQQYFYFQDLIKQETHSGTASFVNPCNTTQPIPSTVKTFMHTRPVIDWRHQMNLSRSGSFDGETATVINMGTTSSPVSGSPFGGSTSIGGVFYRHTDFPTQFQNTYFFGDYATKWIRSMVLDANDKPVSIQNFYDLGPQVVAMATHPTAGGIYFINYTSELRKITYTTSNRPPVAVATSDKKYGLSPLTVQFTGSSSSDPEAQPLTFLWNFGDGTTSTLANPSHVFNAPANTPTNYTVMLTVTDNNNFTDKKSIIISVNNTPPQITSISPSDGTLYTVTAPTTLQLRATVTDKEHSSSQLFYEWQTILYHGTHNHPEPVDTARATTTTLSPYGCGTEIYYYRIVLTVKDAKGLATIREVQLNPYCGQVTSFTLVNAETDRDIQTLNNGAILNLRTLPTKNLNIRANTNPATVGSVVFNVSGKITRNSTDGVVPYAVFGDVNGNYTPWNPGVGKYILKATPYPATSGTGTTGTPLTINFNVENSNSRIAAIAPSEEKNNVKDTTNEKDTSLQIVVESDLKFEDVKEPDLTVIYYPNPFKQQFTLLIQGKTQEKITVKVYDIVGRTVIELDNVQKDLPVVLGKELLPGTYLLDVRISNVTKRYKLVKTP